MKRVFTAVLALSLAIGVGSTVSAQDLTAVDGSFGGGYIQHYPGYLYGVHGNQWAAYFGNPPPATAYMVVPVAPLEQPTRRARAQGRNRAPAPYRRALPQGQAILPNGLPPSGFVPLLRTQTYGWGYGLAPYGTDYYSGMYKGYMIP